MKNHDSRGIGVIHAFAIVFALYLWPFSQVHAQQNADIIEGVLRLKVSENLAAQLESSTMRRTSNDVLLTGIQSLDRVNEQFQVRGMERVFRHAGKFEEKHRRYGLHRWYQVSLDQSASVLAAIQAFEGIQEVEVSEPVLKKIIVGANSESFGPQPVLPEELTSRMATLPGPSNDPFLESQWHYNNTGQTGGTPGTDISLFQAWGLETGSSDVIVAVTDGGIQVDHPDLVANMWVNTEEIPGNGIDDDNNGYIDDMHGYGFGDDTGDIAPDAHGTHVGGTIAATTNNGIGVAGVAGGSGTGDGVRLMSCAAFGAVGTGGFAETYIYGADMGAIISQNSWGYTNPGVFEQAVLDAIDYFIAEAGHDELGNQVGLMDGGLVIFAAGNDDLNAEWYPGYYDATLSVSATTHIDTKAWYSNYGEWVEMAAPGGETAIPEEGILSTLSNSQYGFFQGTSMACPHVSGVAALIISRYGGTGFSPNLVWDRLVQTTDNIDAADPGFAGLLGSGRLNAFAALQSNDSLPPEPVTDLSAFNVGITSLSLLWTAPVDQGNGSASVYDIRYSTSMITEANFDTATPVASPPAPGTAGSLDSVTITGLSPGTTYYFALRSYDFFGNGSLISNVVNQSTYLPPVIALSDSTLEVNLQTAETATQAFTISNEGAGPLEFILVNSGPDDFATPSVSSGVVAPDSSLTIEVLFNASGLFSGTYTQVLQVVNNDPANDSVPVTLTLNVTGNGTPIASFDPADSLYFGAIFTGASSLQTVTISNAGSEPLAVYGATADHPDFVVMLDDSVQVLPFEAYDLNVLFSPTSLGTALGTLAISTSDSASALHQIVLYGEGLPAPDITVSPDSLSETLFTGSTGIQNLLISNTGESPLEFTLTTSTPSGGGDSLSSAQVALPTQHAGISQSQLGNKATARHSQQQSFAEIKWVNQSASASSVLILTPDTDVSQLAALLNGFEDVSAAVFPADSLPAITLSNLMGYDVVMTTNNTQWLAAGGIDPSAVGDLLADYVDAGGKVIVNQFAYSYDAWSMEGRFIDEGYGPFSPATTDAVADVSLGSILAPGHPVMNGVSTLNYSGFVQNVGLAPDAVALASWDNSELLLAANSNTVALNLLPSLGNGSPFQWTGDLALIYHNAIHYLSGPSFLDFSVTEGTVAPGASVNVDVLFDADGLDAGIYQASVEIGTNVPGKELVSVPATLTVTGPEFSVSPDSLHEVLETGETVIRTITLSNHGDGSYPFTVDVSGTSPVSGVTFKTPSAQPSAFRTAARVPQPPARTSVTPIKGKLTGTQAIVRESTKKTRLAPAARQSSKGQLSTVQYTTGFEEFAPGDVNGQNGWFGEWGNWTIESLNPQAGSQHLRGLSDGFGLSQAFSPNVGIGSDPVSSTSMKLNFSEVGVVTWQIVPQSPSAEVVVTRLQFSADSVLRALVDDGAGGALFEDIPVTIPSGYFDLSLEVSRASSMFTVSINGSEVFTGQGFAGDIEEVVILSLMEAAGPTLDIDEFRIFDGSTEQQPDFLTVSPMADTLHAGESIEISVTFDAGELDFGSYHATIDINIADENFVVPASLQVVGDPQIFVSPTVLQTVVPYQGDTTQLVTIENTGGHPLEYAIQVIGADTDIANLPASPESRVTNWRTDERILQKLALEANNAPEKATESVSPAAVQLLAGTALFEEDFEGDSIPPSGWEVVDNEGTGVVWSLAADYGEGNYAGTGEAATVSSDAFGVADYDTELRTPWISTEGFKNITVQYNANYINLNTDFLDLDIQLEGDSTWTTVLSWNEDHGTFFGTPGELVTVELDDYLQDAASFKLRWHYYNPETGDWDWYAQIDDVLILGDPQAWLTLVPATGIVPVGETAAVEARFDAEDVDSGFYVAGAIISSNAAQSPVVGLLASMEVLEPAVISVTPDSIYQELMVGESAIHTLTISNTGASPLSYSFDGTLPASASAKARIPATQTRSSETPATPVSMDGQFISRGVNATPLATSVYGTGFEEFAPGDIDGQEGWAGQWGNWTVEALNAYEGDQHFRGLADGLGQSLAFTPNVGTGSEPTSSVTMMVNFDNAATSTWQIIPQSTTAELVVTRFVVNPDQSLEVLVSDSLGGGSLESIPASLPSGYFELKIEADRASSAFVIYFDQNPVFSGQGFAGDIEEVAILSLMETAGPVLDIDNLILWDGAAEQPWLVLHPRSGVVPAGSSADITLELNATDLEKGVYAEVLSLVSNDPVNPQLHIPVILDVDENLSPVLAPVSDTSVVELSTMELTFTATDPDDSVLMVSLVDAPGFISQLAQSNGSASYQVAPQVGDAGNYLLSVIAEDGRGMQDSAYFVLTVAAYGVSHFYLVNELTGQTVRTFTDSVTLDINDPDFYAYSIQAATNPPSVGSVKFSIDGSKKNIDSYAPYRTYPVLLLGLNGGTHDLEATAYTKAGGKGQAGTPKHAVIQVSNTTEITGLQVVNRYGEVLMNLTDSSVINIKDRDFKYINITATTNRTATKVEFELNGKLKGVDYFAPYSMMGDLFGFFGRWNAKPGHYTLKVTPYAGLLPLIEGEAVTVHFEVTNGNANARVTEEGTLASGTPEILLFPVPTNDEVVIQTTGVADGDVQLVLVDLQGRVIYSESLQADRLQGKTLSLDKLNARSGVYYLKIRSAELNITREIIRK